MPIHVDPNLAMGFYFYPRGGSAQVVRYLCRALGATRWAPKLFAGSLGPVARSSNADRFFSGIPCESLDYSAAQSSWARGADPMAGPVPMHASYEDKSEVPDRVFVDLDDHAYMRQVDSWCRLLAAHPATPPEVVHLHHLTPIHEAVGRVWPHVPVITHLHGTELKMLSLINDGSVASGPGHWTSHWVERMHRWARESDRLVVVSAQDEQLAKDLLPIDARRVTMITSGVDTEVFAAQPHSPRERLEIWKRWLVDNPRGWRPGMPEGSVRYDANDLSAFTDETGASVPVVLYSGRFMRFKQLPLLIEAHHSMRETTGVRSALVIAGGYPGEWEGEHPYDTINRLGAHGVFLAGWRDHDDLATILSCSDVFAAPAVDEPFGLVYLEAMAAGLAPIATNTGGPATFINVDHERPTGWLVAPNDISALSAALFEAVSHPAERVLRGTRAARFVREQYSWSTTSKSFAGLYEDVVAERDGSRAFDTDRDASGVA